MLVKVYGTLDIISGIVLVLEGFDLIGWRFPFFMAVYLLVKSLAYWGSFTSFLDFVLGAYLIAALFIGNIFLSIAGAAYLVYKGVKSFF